MSALRIGFVGAGRVGQGLARALDAASCQVVAVSSRSRASAEALAASVPGCVAFDDADAVAERCDLVFVTTPDAAIAEAASAVRWASGQSVVHCSGATEISALSAAADRGAFIGGFHPMQTFVDPEVAAASLRGCTVTIEADAPLDGILDAIADRLGCPVNRLPPSKRALYHATVGYGSQFVNVLLAEIAGAWRGWGASDEDVVRAVVPMIRGTLASIESAGIADGMPGPVSRGDVETIGKHVDALAALGPDALSFYTAHCRRTVSLARRAGRIDGRTETRLLEILKR